MGLRPLFAVFLVFFESELDIVQEVVVCRFLAKLIGGAISYHKAIELVALEVGDF